jgi:serine protease inhibitor ecotin
MLKLIPKALLAAMAIASFLSVSVAQADQTDIQKLWQSSGYAQAGKGMRTM